MGNAMFFNFLTILLSFFFQTWYTHNIHIYTLYSVFSVLKPHIKNTKDLLELLNARALLIVDGHSSRSDQTALLLLDCDNIDMFFLPPHSSTILQPLDLRVNGVFKSLLKDHFQVVGDEPKHQTQSQLLQTSMVCLQTSLTPLYIQAGFCHAGIHPYDPEITLKSSLILKDSDSDIGSVYICILN